MSVEEGLEKMRRRLSFYKRKLNQMGSSLSGMNKDERKNWELSLSLALPITDLFLRKLEGNGEFRSGKYAEAIEHYTIALSSNIESRPFAAIFFCNRAAAHQALGQIADAIADCSMAIALDGNYANAVSRRATLHEMVRDYRQAASDLQRLISIHEKAKRSGTSGTSTASMKELRQAQQHMPLMEEAAKKGIPLDFYLILGIQRSANTASDTKKAYHKAALKHHPDKAGQLLARSEGGGKLWKKICQDVQKDANMLFKMIGEAYAVLSDPTKHSHYDLEEKMSKVLIQEKMSKAPKENHGNMEAEVMEDLQMFAALEAALQYSIRRSKLPVWKEAQTDNSKLGTDSIMLIWNAFKYTVNGLVRCGYGAHCGFFLWLP